MYNAKITFYHGIQRIQSSWSSEFDPRDITYFDKVARMYTRENIYVYSIAVIAV